MKIYNPYFLEVNTFYELEKKVRMHTQRGFELLDNEFKEGQARVKTPTGRVLTKSKIYRNLRKLRFGDRLQLETLDALDFFHLNERCFGRPKLS